ncbi:MAG TPA: hypothetical protein VMG98_15635 [Verrucomicrobiae bacterium]|nr:hypothetical protein [Verrucomicrobiae bacterium]
MAFVGRFALDGSAGLRPVAHRALRAFTSIVLVLAAFSTIAGAQSLQRLTVTQLTLTADTMTPHIEVPFHLIVTAHVRERISELDNLDLPILAELELLGDEHVLVTQRGGTTYRETITVVAHHSGAITIAPVTLDATNALNGKNYRYSSNSLTLHVLGPAAAIAAAGDAWQGLRSLLSALLRLALILAGLAGTILLVAVLIRRRPPPVPVVTLAPAVPVARDPRATLREALAALQRDHSRAGAMRARHVVRRMVGATDAETLADVLRRPLAGDRQLRDLLRALERAGFTYDADLPAALAAALTQLERMTR